MGVLTVEVEPQSADTWVRLPGVYNQETETFTFKATESVFWPFYTFPSESSVALHDPLSDRLRSNDQQHD